MLRELEGTTVPAFPNPREKSSKNVTLIRTFYLLRNFYETDKNRSRIEKCQEEED